MKRKVRTLLNRVLIWLVVFLLPEGYELTLERVRVIKHIAKKNKLFRNHDKEYRDTLQHLFGITKHQAILLWGEFEEVEKEVFKNTIEILSEIIPTCTLNDYFINRKTK